MRAFALMIVEAYNWDSWKELAHSVETGEVGLEKTLGMKVFEYLDRHPDHARVFVFSHRGAFASCAAWHQQSHPAIDLPIDERTHALFIN